MFMEIKNGASVRNYGMDQEYSMYGPEASYVQPFAGLPPALPPLHQSLHEMQPPHYMVPCQPSISDYIMRSDPRPPMSRPAAFMTAADGGFARDGARESAREGSDCSIIRPPKKKSKHPLASSSAGPVDNKQLHNSSTEISSIDNRSSRYSLSRVRTVTLGDVSFSSTPKNSDYGNETEDDSTKTSRTDNEGRKNHSEIEKRRRDKMNTYITELGSMIPMCGGMARKLDKLTVLRMAVQHLKSIHGSVHAFPEGSFKPEFLSERELRMLILQAADGFLFVADCDRGRMIYVSESVSNLLMYSQSGLVGQSLFDILHPKDVAKVKEQLSSPDVNSRERLVDAKTMLPMNDVVLGTSRPSPGARRSFFCRMKIKPSQGSRDRDQQMIQDQERGSSRQTDRKYCVVQCTGYLKVWTSSEINESSGRDSDEEDDATSGGSLSCLVAIGRKMPEVAARQQQRPAMRQLQFVSRHATDGKFVYVDQRVTPAVGYLPQEINGNSLYEYVAPGLISDVARVHKAVLQTLTPQCTEPYPFKRKDRTWASVQTDFRPFKNPWTKEVECLVAQHTIRELYTEPPSDPERNADALFPRESDLDMRTIGSQFELNRVGSDIADELMQSGADVSAPALPQELVLYQNDVNAASLSDFEQVRDNVALSDSIQPEAESVLCAITCPDPSNDLQIGSTPDGNDEAAMAVIMSLLEADAGLGGPVDFSGLPWPLP